MAALTKMIQTRAVYDRFAGGSGLEKGQVFAFTPGTSNNAVPYPDRGSGPHFCWQSPGYGTAIIEVWGAGGSGGLQCCCNGSVPGNPGAYSKKTVCMEACGYICGCVGYSCGNNSLCFRGCSCPTCICWYSGQQCCNGRICAMGGRGGWAFCNNGSSPSYCCFLCCLFAGSRPSWVTGDGCGMVCNYSTCATEGFSCAAEGVTGNEWNVGRWMACAYGGDVNCCGGWSCTLFLHCNGCCWSCNRTFLRMPFGMFTEKQSVIEFGADQTDGNIGAFYIAPYFNTVNGLTRSPTSGMPYMYCWSGGRVCSCYESWGCVPYVGVGVPGVSAWTCPAIRDHAMRGGNGGVRIQFIPADAQAYQYNRELWADEG